MELPERDGDGYLVDMNDWTLEIGHAMAEADGVMIDDSQWEQILKAREYYEDNNIVPPIRKFAKYTGGRSKGAVQAMDDRAHETHYQIRGTTQTNGLRLTNTLKCPWTRHSVASLREAALRVQI